MTSPTRSFARVAAFSAALFFAAVPARLARAGDGPPRDGEEEGPATAEKIKAQMEKIVRLMKENEKAILEASQGAGKAPKPVDVKPPDAPPDGAPPVAPPPAMSGGDDGKGSPAGEKGDEVKKRIEELIRGTDQRGQQIPGELEELIRMIPVQSGQSPQGGEGGKPLPKPDDAEARKRQNKPEDGTKPTGAEKSPKTPAGERRSPSDTPPKPGEDGAGRRENLPAWLTELPPEVRKLIIDGDTEKIPPEHQDLIKRYQQWLLDHAGKR